MQDVLSDFLTSGVFAFILVFVRIGTALMIMPGIGDSFVSERIRLYIAMGLTLVLTPVMQPFMPAQVPPIPVLLVLIVSEFLVGLFFGTVARIMIAALDTAGMIVSTQSGLANAQIFNPGFASQGSIIGAFFSITGVTVLFASGMHQIMIAGLVDSYQLFPVGKLPEIGGLTEIVSKVMSVSFSTGIRLAAPFIVVALVIYIGMGVLSRLMPQIQVFMLIMPLQILLSLVVLGLTVSMIMLYWLQFFESGLTDFLIRAE